MEEFLNEVKGEQKREDSFALLDMMEKITGCKAKKWGTSIVGFDRYHYKYASGREGDWPITCFSPRKNELSIYIMNGFDSYKKQIKKLGKHKKGKSCLYIKKLSDVNLVVLEEIITDSVKRMRAKKEDECA